MRAFSANDVDEIHVPWTVEGLQFLFLFLLFWRIVIFLFNIDHKVFGSLIWWIGRFSIVHGLITVMPIVSKSFTFLNNTTPFRPTDNATIPHPDARGLCSGIGRFEGQCGAAGLENGDGATSPVDAR